MNLVLLCGKGMNHFQSEVVKPFLESSQHVIQAAVIDDRPPQSLLKKLKKNLGRGRGGFVLVMVFQSILRQEECLQETAAFFAEHKIPTIRTTRPYSEETLATIRGHTPDALILLGGFGIVKEGLINLTRGGVLSYHHGNMRSYRGMPPGLWEVYNGDREMGVTVQTLGAGLDSGDPIVEKTIPIRYTDTPGSLRARALSESTDMMYEAACRLNNPNFTPEKINSYGPLYTLPNLRQWLILQSRVAVRKLKALMGAP